MKKLAVIDGMSVFYRGYYAMPNLSLADGTPTGGVFGFATLAIELIKKIEPDYVAVAWDKRGTNTRKRREIYPEYKAGRKSPPDDFYAQIPILHELLDAFGWPFYEIDDYEADDILGAFAKQAEARGVETYLLTSDLDALQLVSPLTKMMAIKNGLASLVEYTPEYFKEKHGIEVGQFLDLKALKGDASDNLPGVPGVGEKTAVKLLNEYGDLDNIFAHVDEQKGALKAKLENGKESAYVTKEVAKIQSDIPVELDWDVADVNDADFERVAEILRQLEFRSLINRLPKNMRAPDSAKEIAKVEVGDLNDKTTISPEICLYIDMFSEPTLYIASSPNLIYRSELGKITPKIWQKLNESKIIAYDIKSLYHELAEKIDVFEFAKVHDVRQAAFLLEPLRRDRGFFALAGVDDGADLTPEQRVAKLYEIYENQKEAFAKNPEIEKVAREFDFPVIWSLFQMERRGILLDVEQMKTMSQELAKEVDLLEQKMYDMAGYEFNVASPAQLSEVLFTKLMLPTTGIKKGKTNYSTSQKELNKLRGQHPIIELIERYRELSKLQNTYVDALPKLVDKNNRLHTTLNQDVTSTGRLSSTNPNLQNIPVRTELGRRIRQAFVPSPGKVFVSADYSQFELRLAAVLAGDQALIDDFNSGVDIHTKTAAEVYGVELEAVTSDQRRAAKVINFGVLYGMSPHGLASAADMTFGEAKKFIEHYFEVRRPIREYLDKTLEQAIEDGYVETFYGRRRPTPDVQSSNFMVREAAKRAAMNMPIQGTEADLMKRAMVRLEERLAGIGEQVLQIHDSILVECAPGDAEKVGEIMKSEMEAIAPDLAIRLHVDVMTGENWGEL